MGSILRPSDVPIDGSSKHSNSTIQHSPLPPAQYPPPHLSPRHGAGVHRDLLHVKGSIEARERFRQYIGSVREHVERELKDRERREEGDGEDHAVQPIFRKAVARLREIFSENEARLFRGFRLAGWPWAAGWAAGAGAGALNHRRWLRVPVAWGVRLGLNSTSAQRRRSSLRNSSRSLTSTAGTSTSATPVDTM